VVWVGSVVLAGLTASFALWDPLEVYEREHLCQTTFQLMDSLRADIRSDVRSRLLAQVRLAELWSDKASSTPHEQQLGSRLFLDHHDGYLGLEWMDAGRRVLWSVTREGYATRGVAPAARVALSLVGAAASARADTHPTVTPRFPLPDGRSAFRLVVPVVRGGGVEHFLVAIVDVRAALDAMLEDHKDLGYSVSVLDGATEIYRMPGSEPEYDAALTEQGTLELPGVAWTIRVWPKPEILSRSQSSLPRLAMVLGGLLGSVLMLAIHFGRSAQNSSRELQQAHDELEERVRERTLELEKVNIVLQAEVAERKRAEDSHRDLSGRLLRLQDEERRRIARELHDSTAQMLGALAINMDRSVRLVHAHDCTRLQRVLAESGQLLEEVTQEIRTVSYLLHPPMLDDLGLEYVLPWYAAGFSRRSGIASELDIQANLGRLPCEAELTLFRIVQEALANVHRHSGSATVAIHLSRTEDSVILEVRDHGSGLPEGVLEAATNSSATAPMGVGIAGMRERVRQLHGRMEIASELHGTTLRTVLPLGVDG